MIDAEQYIYQLVTRDALALDVSPTVASDLDVDTIDELPFWGFTVTGDGQVANGPGLWTFQLSWNVFAEGRDAAFASAAQLYALHHAWMEDPSTTVLEIEDQPIWVAELEDIDIFSRTARSVINGRDIVQFTGTFALAIRS